MLPMYLRLTVPPDVDELTESSERAALSLLAAAAQCARNALVAAHKAEFLAMGADCYDETPSPAVALVAGRVTDCIDDLMESLLLYDATLRDTHCARLRDDEPF